MDTIPLPMPPELIAEVKRTAQDAGLSSAEIMRQSIKAGLPKVRDALASLTKSGRVTNVEPIPKKTLDKIYAEREDDTDAIRRMIAAQPFEAE